MLPILSWRAWTTDGTTYDSKHHSWSDVPETGFQILCLYHAPPYRDFVMGIDIFSLAEFRDAFVEAYPADGDLEKQGEWMADDAFWALYRTAHDEGWP